jgi:hypothetical protein
MAGATRTSATSRTADVRLMGFGLNILRYTPDSMQARQEQARRAQW